ncbi:MAG TPA: prephenate dehydrogenase/arogenate dehydrogenase family protein [Candidatus Ornithospirochaeta avicola]|uniref:Prephenate dehydrogenase/arogenate dehydrogenase family protein n=1 Tax=Candidatus Ornithospirochaeta avicola TaxID=2840896 RepID=A0A9D1PU07_9SPIO|nr:prephenate dehydrogenase/arogenate dehydrogenase family protein [Candidatus Ornithospirochaeta avicola]
MIAGVYGLGRFGSFFSSLLAKGGFDVIAYSRSKHDAPENVRIVSEDEVLSADYLFFCVSIRSFESLLERVKDKIGENTVVLDTCSVKTEPEKWMRKHIKKNEIIPTHPMFGPDSAASGCKGLPFVFCAKDRNSERYLALKKALEPFGFKILEMTSLEHDREAAYSQGVTHFVGRVLDKMNMKDTEIATKGYRTLMQIVSQTCNDSLELFYDLQRFNPYAKEMRLSLQFAVEKVLNDLMENEE